MAAQPKSAPVVHSVYFYDSDIALVQRLIGIVNSGLAAGNAVIMVMTREHEQQMEQYLSSEVMREAKKSLKLTLLDAEETLKKFMVKGRPDPVRFDQVIGSLLDSAKHRARNAERGLTVFGEMVAVLWNRGEKQAALELEELWNDTLNDRRFYLHCAYPRQEFEISSDAFAIQAICDRHTHAFGTSDRTM